jgi:hypothetical protein
MLGAGIRAFLWGQMREGVVAEQARQVCGMLLDLLGSNGGREVVLTIGHSLRNELDSFPIQQGPIRHVVPRILLIPSQFVLSYQSPNVGKQVWS